MPRAKRPLAEADINVSAPAPKRGSKKSAAKAQEPEVKPAANGNSKSKRSTKTALKYFDPSFITTSDIKYITFCWPDPSNDDEEEGAEEKVKGNKKSKAGSKKNEKQDEIRISDAKCGTKTCMCKKFHDQNPDWPIFLSEEGSSIMFDLMNEKEKRDQDNFGMYIYNDWSGWGTAEVMVNALTKFNKLIFDKRATPAQKWALVEGIGMFLQSDFMHFLMNEDGLGNAEIVGMFGTLLLTSFDMLAEAGLFKKDSPIQNISFISTLYLGFIIGVWVDDINGETGWMVPVVRALEHACIDILHLSVLKAVSKDKIDEIRGQIHENEEKDAYKEAAAIKTWTTDDDGGIYGRQWHRWDWKKEWTPFHKDHKGGRKYDLTKMSAAERRSYELGGDSWI